MKSLHSRSSSGDLIHLQWTSPSYSETSRPSPRDEVWAGLQSHHSPYKKINVLIPPQIFSLLISILLHHTLYCLFRTARSFLCRISTSSSEAGIFLTIHQSLSIHSPCDTPFFSLISKMSFSKISAFSGAVAFATRVAAHGIVTGVVADGV